MIKEQQSSSSPSFKIFQISDLHPLFHVFDVPAPIIHPPGSDPHRGDGLKKISPMDVDPCVAASRCEIVTKTIDLGLEPICPMDVDPCVSSRCQIVAKRTDLTASEHAGVTLNESTTMVCITSDSDSLARSKVIAQQMVNDVVVPKTETDVLVPNLEADIIVTTKTESENTGSATFCDICNISCNSEKAFKCHIEGKKHSKNTRKTDSKKKNQDLLQKETSIDSLLFCSNPDLGSQNKKMVTVAQVTKPLCTDELLNPASVTSTPIEHSTGGAQKEDCKLVVHNPNWCNLCKVSCSGEMSLKRHVAGIKHRSNLQRSQKVVTHTLTNPMENLKSTESENSDLEDGKTGWCTVSNNYGMRTDIQKHLSGKKHLKNLLETAKLPKSPSLIIGSVDKPLNDTVEELKLTKGEVVYPKEGNGHKNNSNESEKMFRPLHSPVRHDEGKIVFSERSKRKGNSSLSSDDDVVAKRHRMVEQEELGSGVILTCIVCSVVCTGYMAYASHFAGKEHSAVALKKENVGRSE